MDPSTIRSLSVWLLVAATTCLCHAEHIPTTQDCVDEGASFVQLSKHAARAKRHPSTIGADRLFSAGDASGSVSSVACDALTKPLQVVKGAEGVSVKELDIGNETLTELFTIPFDSVAGGYTELNACGINPLDSIIYCVMSSNGESHIVRLDQQKVEFVAKVPWDLHYTGGDFSPSGIFYVSNRDALFLVAKELDQAQGFSDLERNSDAMLDLSEKVRQCPTMFNWVGDVVAVRMDLEGLGPEEYIVVLYGPELHIARYETVSDRFTKTWNITVNPTRWDNIYGSAWHFQNKVFFSANNRNGIFQLPLEQLNLKDDLGPDFVLELIRIGDSVPPGGENDGMSCIIPPRAQLTQFDCKAYPGALQASVEDDGYGIGFLDVTEGYSSIFQVPKSITSPPIKRMNAFGLNPVDSLIYASVVIGHQDNASSAPPPFYIVRLDSKKKLEFVAKVQAQAGAPVAGTFDDKGTYFVVSNPALFQFPDVSSMRGFGSHRDDLPYFGMSSPKPVAIVNHTGAEQLFDIVAINENFDGEGSSTWVLGVNTARQVIAMKPDAGQEFIVPTNDFLEGMHFDNNAEEHRLGSAWNFKGRVFVASNSGAGVFEVPVEKIRLPNTVPIDLKQVGESMYSQDDDGFTCGESDAPFGGEPEVYHFEDPDNPFRRSWWR